MAVLNHVSPHPKFSDSALVPSSVAALRKRLSTIAAALAGELAKPSDQLAQGILTMAGAQQLRRQAAARSLVAIDAEVPALLRIEAEVEAARASQDAAVAAAEAALPVSTMMRAQTTASYFSGAAAAGTADAGERKRFTEAVHNGAREAVLAAALLPAFGPWASLHEVARTKFAASVIPPAKAKELRALDVSVRIARGELTDLRDIVDQIAKSGTEPAPDARALLERANDADRNALVAEGIELGIFQPPSTSTGTPSTAGTNRIPAMVAGEASNVGVVRTGGR